MDAKVEKSLVDCLPALRLENEFISASVLPDPGAKIFDLLWKTTGRQILWQNPRIRPASYPIEANFDNYWCGGWDEGFPTCDACNFNGESYPNLGELRSLRWRTDFLGVVSGAAIAELSAYGPITPVQARKRIVLHGRTVTVSYELCNIGPLSFDFIWGSHPALGVTPKTVLHIPAATGIVGVSSAPALGKTGQRYSWPVLETEQGSIDMSRVHSLPASSFCGHYATELRAGVYGVEFAEEGLALTVRFSQEQCPWLWTWLVNGGWRGYYHAIVEPWTSCPVNLAEAVVQKTHRRLEPGAVFSTDVSLTVCDDLQEWRDEIRRMNPA